MREHLCQAAAAESMDWLPLAASALLFRRGLRPPQTPICPGTRDPLLLEQAPIIGATTCVLGVRAERMARMERLHNCMLRYTEHALDFQLFGRTNPKFRRGTTATIGPAHWARCTGPTQASWRREAWIVLREVCARRTAIGKPSRKPDRANGGHKLGGRGGRLGASEIIKRVVATILSHAAGNLWK
jgi:hypothetical protein